MTRNFLRSKHCLEELQWACDEMQQRGRQAQQGRGPAPALVLVPIFYHHLDPVVGFGVDRFKCGALTGLLDEQHAAASEKDRAQWLQALLLLAKRTGIRQDSTGRWVLALAGRAQTFEP